MRPKIKKSIIYFFIIFISLFGLLYIIKLSNSNEGFINIPFNKSFEEILKKIKELQNQSLAYDNWVGYIYKNPSKNGEILNDFKSRVFHPSCKFRNDWATNLPKGMTIPTPANSPDAAMLAYKKYLSNLKNGKDNSGKQLYNARDRFMDKDCRVLNDPSQYTREYTVHFK
jgi:hypothetical protein